MFRCGLLGTVEDQGAGGGVLLVIDGRIRSPANDCHRRTLVILMFIYLPVLRPPPAGRKIRPPRSEVDPIHGTADRWN
jgi:hypothetical protein